VTTAEYLVGAGLTVTMAASLGIAGWAIRRRLLPAWTGPPARVAEIVLALSGFVLLSEALGLAGLFRRAPLVLSCIVLGLAAWAYGRRRASAVDAAEATARNPPAGASGVLPIAIATFASVLGAATWLANTRSAFQNGMLEFDTLWYHMPFAARFAHEGSVGPVHYVGDVSPSYLPATAELFHGAGILVFGSDLLSPALNLGWLGFAFLAAWCIGRPSGVAPATLTTAALILSGATLAGTQAGSAKNDVVALALLLAATALLANGRDQAPAAAVAGLAAGLAVGVRLNALAPVLALTVAVLLLNTDRRRATSWWLAGVVATGSFWYLRNLVEAANPLPWLGLDLGFVSLPSIAPPADCGTTSVADYAGRLDAAREDLLPQLDGGLGPVWPLLLAIPGAGIVAGISAGLTGRRARLSFVLASVGLAALIAYLFTPTTAGGIAGRCFGYNTRFAAPALLFGAMALPLLLAKTRIRASWVVAALAVVIVLNMPPEASKVTRGAAALLAALGVLLVAAVAKRRAIPRAGWVGALGLAGVLALAGGWLVRNDYLRDRYTDGGLPEPTGPSYMRLRNVDGARIAVAGFLAHYPLYGRKPNNTVVLPAQRLEHGDLRRIRSCREWLAALAEGRYDYVVTAPDQNGAVPPETTWTRADPRAREVIAMDGNVVFRLRGNRGNSGNRQVAATCR
jgi:hypothetical protein